MNTLPIITLALVVVFLTSCGTGGGGDSGDGGSSTINRTSLGDRAVPGFKMAVTLDLPPEAGAARTVTVKVTPEENDSPIASISAGIADAATENPNLIPGTSSAGSENNWTWMFKVPNDMSGKRVVVEIQDSNGNISMSGFPDFMLK